MILSRKAASRAEKDKREGYQLTCVKPTKYMSIPTNAGAIYVRGILYPCPKCFSYCFPSTHEIFQDRRIWLIISSRLPEKSGLLSLQNR